ncbi:sugar phosphate isomerase/epimerase family protein [Brachybacterium endophyticum]|uniref:sugar phosphate isomerase/epimerase family protein n=1 Tax=Brachybacterium endophyticum TaxID=2182385 RepID=UPI0014034711|nr:sugar phosphate isomerase/epimerase family protein [Brachybacterium endophyticum]
MPHGVIADIAQQRTVLLAGADYLEPTVVGSLVVQDAGGSWRDAEVTPDSPIGSCAVLVPSTVRIADPSVPIAAVREYLRTALGAIGRVALPGTKAVLGSGAARTIGPDVRRGDGIARFADVLTIARDLAAEQGLEIILEPLHRGETDLIHSIEEAAEFLDAHGIGGVRIVADLFHIQKEGERLETVERFAGRIGHVHVADTDRMPPGQGDWPIAPFLGALRRGGCSSDVTIECSWRDLAEELPDALAVVRAADPLLR